MRKFILILAAAMVFAACNASRIQETNTVNSSSHQLIEMDVEFAETFEVESIDSGYLVRLIDPNSHETEREITLSYDLSTEGDDVVHLPLKNIVNLSQTTVGMMAIIDQIDLIVGISGEQYLHNAELIEKSKNGSVKSFGDESDLPVESIIAANAQLVLYSGFSKVLPGSDKLEKVGIRSIPIYDWRETHPLGKAEWIKFIGIICGQEQEAVDFFETVKKEYENLKWRASKVNSKPTVLSGNLLGDVWYSPAGQSYMATMLRDAGGEYVYKNSQGTGSTENSIEQIIIDNESTNFWLNPGIDNKSKLVELNPKAPFIGPFNGGLYCYSSNMNEYWERSAAEPHLVLEDLIRILQPDLLEKGEFHFYRKLEE